MKKKRVPAVWCAVLLTFSTVIITDNSILRADNSAANKDLLKAAEEGDYAKVKRALAKGADINARTRYRTTALIEASGKGHIKIVKLLLKKGANVHLIGGYKGTEGGTALGDAAGETRAGRALRIGQVARAAAPWAGTPRLRRKNLRTA